MAERWFYRLFGEEFGPVSFEKLKELSELGTIAANDEVRSERDSQWVMAATVEHIGQKGSFDETASSMACLSNTDTELTAVKSGADDWFYRSGDQELGPLRFEELLSNAQQGQLTADDEVKLGTRGKWRRAGSIGRLMAVLPYQSVQKKLQPASSKAKTAARNQGRTTSTTRAANCGSTPAPDSASKTVDTEAAYQAAYELAKAQIAQSMISQAEATYQAAEEQAKAEFSWAFAPNADRQWWGWMGGVEFGPVEFMQVFALARNGQLKPSDFIRNGQYGQYVPSANVPGLFNAVTIVARAAEALKLARSQAEAAAALAAPPPKMPVIAPRPAAIEVVDQPVPAASAGSAKQPEPARQPQANVPRNETARPDASSVMTGLESSQPTMQDPPPPERAISNELTSPASRYEPRVNSSFSSSSLSGSNYSAYGGSSGATHRPSLPSRPIARRPARSSDPWFSEMLESLKEPKAFMSLAAIALVFLVGGWSYLPKSRGDDIKRYNALKGILDELREKRSNNSTDFAGLTAKAEQVRKQIINELKTTASRDEPAKQHLLWAARDDLPKLMTEGLARETPIEKTFAGRLQEAAVILGLARPPAQNAPDAENAAVAARGSD